jgi:dTDP-glucose 4,6-dehydratase
MRAPASLRPSLSTADLDHILAHTEELWEELHGEQLFVTGGTGFFGMWLLESFLWANASFDLRARATVLTRNPAAFRERAPQVAGHSAITLLQGDVRSFECPPGTFRFVLHAATEASVTLNEKQPVLMEETIVGGTERVLSFAREHDTERLLFISSGAVYGEQEAHTSAYARGKRKAELLCQEVAQAHGLCIPIARCFAFVGPYLPLDIHYAIGNFIRDAIAGGPIRIRGDGTPLRSYLYMADLAIWLWTMLLRAPSVQPYDVGSEDAVSIAELADIVAHSVHPPLGVERAEDPQPGRPPERYVPSTKRARQELGLQQWITLPEAIRRTINWYAREPRPALATSLTHP